MLLKFLGDEHPGLTAGDIKLGQLQDFVRAINELALHLRRRREF